MANGFFLGGAAEGAMTAQQQALKERVAEADIGLRGRGLDLQGRQLEHNISQDIAKELDKRIDTTMAIAAETIQRGIEGGADPAQIKQLVTPLLTSLTTAPPGQRSLAERAGRNPAALVAQIDAQLAAPGPVAAAGVKGRAAGTQRIEQARTEQQQPPGTRVEISPFKEEKDRISAEGSMRDDYVARSKDFVTIRDFMDRIRGAGSGSGADDLGLVFSYMKVLDPQSTVREGEFRTASQIAGLPGVIETLRNRILGTGQLSEDARKDIKQAANKIWTTAASRHSALTNQFANLAKRAGLRPEQVVIDFTAGGAPAASGTTSSGINWNLK